MHTVCSGTQILDVGYVVGPEMAAPQSKQESIPSILFSSISHFLKLCNQNFSIHSKYMELNSIKYKLLQK